MPFRTLDRVGQRLAPLVVALVVVLAMAPLAACSRPTPQPYRPTDARRIVSLAPALTAILKDLGAADRLVGVTRFCDAPGVPVVGDLEPAPEAIMAQHPDVVVMARYGSQGDAADRLRALGLDVRMWPLDSIADMRAATTALGQMVGDHNRAAALLEAYDKAVASAKAAAQKRGRRLKVLLVYDVLPGVVLTTGGGDHVSELLDAAGGDNIAAPGPVTARLALEEVIRRAPDVIIHAAPDPRFPDDAAAMAYWASFPDLPAVKRGAVHVWPDGSLARNGPHLAAVLERLPALFGP